MRFKNRFGHTTRVYCIAALLGLMVGCTGQSNSTPPVLNVADSSAAPAPNATENSIQTDQADPPIPLAQGDPETKALIVELRTNYKAWEDKKPFDFKRAAATLTKRLETNFDVNLFRLASDAAEICMATGSYDSAKQIFAAIEKAATRSDDAQLATMAKEAVVPELTRLNLLGAKPKIEGAVFAGGKFDWSQYKGKVVLLDFWATWCGPCRQELPNVEKTYEKYHSQGFDVVGISLDDSKEKLADFLAREKLPWTILFDEDPSKQGWEGAAMTKEFAINSIPATFLVDRAGKVVSISARGDDLEPQVKKLLAEKE